MKENAALSIACTADPLRLRYYKNTCINPVDFLEKLKRANAISFLPFLPFYFSYGERQGEFDRRKNSLIKISLFASSFYLVYPFTVQYFSQRENICNILILRSRDDIETLDNSKVNKEALA